MTKISLGKLNEAARPEAISRARSGPGIPVVLHEVMAAATPFHDNGYDPSGLLLVVEAVSPSSVTLDRVTKPAIYAEQGIPIIGCEPSCILTLRDEYPDLVSDKRVEAVAAHARIAPLSAASRR